MDRAKKCKKRRGGGTVVDHPARKTNGTEHLGQERRLKKKSRQQICMQLWGERQNQDCTGPERGKKTKEEKRKTVKALRKMGIRSHGGVGDFLWGDLGIIKLTTEKDVDKPRRNH